MIVLTQSAKERIRAFLHNRGRGIGLRIGLKTYGCSGLAYALEFVDEVLETDDVITIDDICLVIDKKNLIYLDGVEIDFVKEGLNEGFKFINPNSKGECGCGESFTV